MLQPVQLARVGETLFPDLDLGDIRRNRRFRQGAQALAENPGASLPQVFPDPAAYNACLRLCDADEASHANILGAHQEAVLNRMERRTDPLLLLHDTTLLDFSGHTTLEDDLGPIGNGTGTGWLAHQTLAVDPTDRTVLGLVSQILHVRQAAPAGETTAQKRQRASRESRLWLRGLAEIGPTPEACHWIDVADRGADIFEFLQALTDRRRRFVVRSQHNRALGAGASDAKAEMVRHDRLRMVPANAHWELDVPARTGKPGRTARLAAVAKRVTLRPPRVRKGDFRREPLEVTAVRVWEVASPAGVEPLEWLLLTNEPAHTPAELEPVGRWYACRMQVEEFHKVQKSGVRVEGFQVQSVEKLAALVAVVSVIAVGLLNLRLALRQPATATQPAREVVPAVWVEVLSRRQTGRPLDWSVAEFWTALARLGGYHKNPQKHPPGWITLWRGWTQLQLLLDYHLSITKME